VEHGRASSEIAFSALSCLLGWALDQGYECPSLKRRRNKAARRRDRVLSMDELRAIWFASLEMQDYGAILRLLMLTGQRLNEIGGLQWKEIKRNGEPPRIELPALRTKNRRAHVVPLSELANAQLPRVWFTDRVHVFGYGPNGFRGWSACKKRLDDNLLLEHWTTHDLRRSFVTYCNELGLAPRHPTSSRQP
jgi:integrase